MSDLDTNFVSSEEEHCLRNRGADYQIFENWQNYSIFRKKLEKSHENINNFVNFQKFKNPPHGCANNALLLS